MQQLQFEIAPLSADEEYILNRLATWAMDLGTLLYQTGWKAERLISALDSLSDHGLIYKETRFLGCQYMLTEDFDPFWGDLDQ